MTSSMRALLNVSSNFMSPSAAGSSATIQDSFINQQGINSEAHNKTMPIIKVRMSHLGMDRYSTTTVWIYLTD